MIREEGHNPNAESLLDEARWMDVEVKRFSVSTLVRSCCAEVEPLVVEKPYVKLVCDVAEGVGDAHTDEGRVRQIVTNLLSNAIRFTEQGEVTVGVRMEAGDIVFAVSDTGTGIPQEALETIFEEELPITKGFVALLGGSISVQSTVGEGSTFTVRMPTTIQVEKA